MKTRYFLVLLLMLSFSELGYTQVNTSGAYEIVYEADPEGNAISGDRNQLLEYVQNGNPIRVGWTLKFKNPQTGKDASLQHWADAGFLTVINNHVFAQISSIYQQGPAFSDPPGVFLVNNKPDGWVAIIGTTGVMRQKFNPVDANIPEDMIKEMETMKVTTHWAVMKR